MLPIHTEVDVYRWILAATIVYLLAAYLICLIRAVFYRGAPPSGAFAIAKLFDGVDFAASLMLLTGVADLVVLILHGNIRPFLMIAGMAGTVHTLHGLFVAT